MRWLFRGVRNNTSLQNGYGDYGLSYPTADSKKLLYRRHYAPELTGMNVDFRCSPKIKTEDQPNSSVRLTNSLFQHPALIVFVMVPVSHSLGRFYNYYPALWFHFVHQNGWICEIVKRDFNKRNLQKSPLGYRIRHDKEYNCVMQDMCQCFLIPNKLYTIF